MLEKKATNIKIFDAFIITIYTNQSIIVRNPTVTTVDVIIIAKTNPAILIAFRYSIWFSTLVIFLFIFSHF